MKEISEFPTLQFKHSGAKERGNILSQHCRWGQKPDLPEAEVGSCLPTGPGWFPTNSTDLGFIAAKSW